jgi:hypothetical protein
MTALVRLGYQHDSDYDAASPWGSSQTYVMPSTADLLIALLTSYTYTTSRSMTWAGNSVNQVVYTQRGSGLPTMAWFGQKLAPTVGSNSLVGAAAGTGASTLYTAAMAIQNVDPDDPFGSSNSSNGSASSVSLEVTGDKAGWLGLIGVMLSAETTIYDAGFENTALWFPRTHGSNWGMIGVGYRENLGAGPATLGLDWSGTCSFSAVAMAINPATLLAGRLIEYTFDMLSPIPRVIDSLGQQVPFEEIKPDEWIRTPGVLQPSAKVYNTRVEDPNTAYIEEVRYRDPDEVEIASSTSEFADVIIARAAGRNAI